MIDASKSTLIWSGALSLALAACSGSSSTGSSSKSPDGGGAGGSASGASGGAGATGGSGGSGATASGGSGGAAAGSGGSAGSAGSGAIGGSGATTSGGNGGSGGSTAGSGGAGGVPTGGSAGSGGSGGVPAPCEANTAPGDTCSAVGARCRAASGSTTCCRCIDFEEASCGLQWECALPENNPPACPERAPTLGATCDDPNTTCQYCTDGGPVFVRCNRVEVAAPTGEWGEVGGLACSG